MPIFIMILTLFVSSVGPFVFGFLHLSTQQTLPF
jgi:hypothetical protein